MPINKNCHKTSEHSSLGRQGSHSLLFMPTSRHLEAAFGLLIVHVHLSQCSLGFFIKISRYNSLETRNNCYQLLPNMSASIERNPILHLFDSSQPLGYTYGPEMELDLFKRKCQFESSNQSSKCQILLIAKLACACPVNVYFPNTKES